MTKLYLITAAVLLSFSSLVNASSFIATTDTLGVSLANSAEGSSDASSSLNDDKRIIAARDDAALFVASNGNLRGVQLEAAFKVLRSYPELEQFDEIQLARSILAQ